MSDTLTDLANAIMRLDNVLRSIGPGVELTAIEVGGSRYAGHALSDALKASPSFIRGGLYPHDAYKSPQIAEVCGVPIRVARD